MTSPSLRRCLSVPRNWLKPAQKQTVKFEILAKSALSVCTLKPHLRLVHNRDNTWLDVPDTDLEGAQGAVTHDVTLSDNHDANHLLQQTRHHLLRVVHEDLSMLSRNVEEVDADVAVLLPAQCHNTERLILPSTSILGQRCIHAVHDGPIGCSDHVVGQIARTDVLLWDSPTSKTRSMHDPHLVSFGSSNADSSTRPKNSENGTRVLR
jgi:hypothetical protein